MLRLVKHTAVAATIFGAGVLAATGFVAGHQVAGASPGAATAASVDAGTIWDTAAAAGAGGRGGFGPGDFGPGGIGLRLRGPLKVTAVNGNTISAINAGGTAITVTVDASTTYREAGASAALSDIQVGSLIGAQGQRTSNTIQATSVEIVLPGVAGVVTAVNGSSLTLTGEDAATHTVDAGSASIQKAGATASLSDITTGTLIQAQGTSNADGSLTAKSITIQLPRLAGKVTAVTGSAITLSAPYGETRTIQTSGSTTYVKLTVPSLGQQGNSTTPTGPKTSPATAADVTNGSTIEAEGTLSADGKTLTALRVVILPADSGMGIGKGLAILGGDSGAGFSSQGGTAPSGTGV